MSTASHQTDFDDPVDVLLVEDNPGDARLLREAFEVTKTETRVHTVPRGNDALDYLTQQGEHESASYPDLVLLDLNLPGRDGCDVLEAIRAHDQFHSLPVLMLTSSDADEDIVRCYSARANAYLTKPTDHDELVSLVETVELFWFERVHLPPLSS